MVTVLLTKVLVSLAILALISPVYSQDCGPLSPPTNGLVDVPATTVSSVATYTCDAGYTLTGVSTRTCDMSGAWDGATPTCAIEDCGPLSYPTNGAVDVTGGTTYLQTATYTCNTGYDLTGGTTRTCQQDGQWSSTAPTCTVKDCGGLVGPSNGLVTTIDGTSYGDSATYTCVVGYTLVGSSSRSCGSDGNWDGSAPVCQPKDCGSPTVITNGAYSITTTTFGSTVTYSCNTNYGLVGSGTISCLSTGAWDTNVPSCAIDCGVPSSITGGSVTYAGGTAVGAQATYTCNSGYTLSGGSTITCAADGTWSTGPTCALDLNGYGCACQSASDCVTDAASCLDGGTGTATCTCSSTTVYDQSLDKCLADCGGLSNPTNGMVAVPTQTIEGQIATYACNSGYALSGSGTRTCQASGSWSGTAPTCTLGCSEPDPPLNGQVNTTGGFTSGSVVTYSCDTGYALVGSSSRICLMDTTWNGHTPSCNRECSVLTDIKNGAVDQSLGNWANSVATYICDKNYALVGQSTRKCESTGLWAGMEPSCLFAMIPDILIVFGVLFILLIIVDIVVLAIFLYKKIYQKKKKNDEDEETEDEDPEDKVEEKKPQFLSFMVERPDGATLPLPPFPQAHGRKSKYSRIAPEAGEDPEVRMRTSVHPPPKKPQHGHLKVEKIERPSFIKTPRDKNEKPLGRERTFDATTFGPEKTRFNLDMILKPTVANSLDQPTHTDTKQTHMVDEHPGKDGYYSRNSDDSNQRRPPSPAEADQLSLDDFDFPEPKTNSSMGRTKPPPMAP